MQNEAVPLYSAWSNLVNSPLGFVHQVWPASCNTLLSSCTFCTAFCVVFLITSMKRQMDIRILRPFDVDWMLGFDVLISADWTYCSKSYRRKFNVQWTFRLASNRRRLNYLNLRKTLSERQTGCSSNVIWTYMCAAGQRMLCYKHMRPAPGTECHTF